MPTVYERDNDRRLITLTITEPYSVDDVINAIERQMAEDTWEYAMLYDMRATMRLSTIEEARLITNCVQHLSGGRKRGPVAMAISGRPEQVRAGVEFARSNSGIAIPDILLTAMQLYDWTARNAPRRNDEGL
jgi:hypothetical protein